MTIGRVLVLCFFNLAGALYDPDVQGVEVESLDSARKLAAMHLAEIIRDEPDTLWKGEEVRVEVSDENQLILFTVIAVGVDAPVSSGTDWKAKLTG